MWVLRRLTAFWLVIAILVTAVAVGQVRGTTRVAGVVVLCTGAGPVSLAVDEKGRPAGRTHLCPDCIQTLLAGIPAAPVVLRPPEGVTDLAALPLSGVPEGRARPAALARGPPLGS